MTSKKEASLALVLEEREQEVKEESLYLTQIEYLTKELKRHQLRSKELQKEIAGIHLEDAAMEKDYKDIHEYLEYRITELSKEEERLIKQLEQEKAETQMMEAEILTIRQENQGLEKVRDELEAKTTMQAARLEELNQLKQRLSRQIADTQKKIESQKTNHEVAKYTIKLEEEDVIQSKREELKRWMEMKCSAIIEEERAKLVEAATTEESLSKEMLALKAEKKKAQSKVRELSPKVDILRAKVDKNRQDILSLKKEKEKLTRRYQRLKAKHEDMVSEAEALTQKQASPSAGHQPKASAKSQLEARLMLARSKRRQVEGDIKKAVGILRTIVSDPDRPDKAQLMLKLQRVLESPGPQETGSTGQTEAGAETETFEKNPLFLLSQIRIGDLGLVPRPTWYPKETQAPAKLPPVREPLWRKAFVQWYENKP